MGITSHPPAGLVGPAGTDGNTVLSGAGAPGGGTGVDGDFYIDTTGPDLYGPKAGGVWGSGTSLVGPSGTGEVLDVLKWGVD